MARLLAALAADALDHVVGGVAGRLVDQQHPGRRPRYRSRGASAVTPAGGIVRAAP